MGERREGAVGQTGHGRRIPAVRARPEAGPRSGGAAQTFEERVVAAEGGGEAGGGAAECAVVAALPQDAEEAARTLVSREVKDEWRCVLFIARMGASS